jgi:ribosomal protein L37E
VVAKGNEEAGMDTAERMTRRYLLTCRRCGRTWEATYEVVAYHDLDGDRELWFRHGVPAVPPWSQITCAACGGQRVRILPRPGGATRATPG